MKRDLIQIEARNVGNVLPLRKNLTEEQAIQHSGLVAVRSISSGTSSEHIRISMQRFGIEHNTLETQVPSIVSNRWVAGGL